MADVSSLRARPRLRLSVAGLFAAALLAAGSGAHGETEAWAEETPSIAGVTQAIHDVTISAPVTGQIISTPIKEGQRVKKGAVLIVLENRFESLEVKRRKLVWESTNELQSARGKVALLASQLANSQTLYDQTRSISREALEEKRLEHQFAVSELASLEVGEKRERLEYQAALAQLKQRTIRAPIAGVIARMPYAQGESVKASEPVIQIVDASQCLFIANVEEATGRSLSQGQQVELRFDGRTPPLKRTGEIIYLSPIVDSASSLMEIKVRFDNGDGAVRPGIPARMLVPASKPA